VLLREMIEGLHLVGKGQTITRDFECAMKMLFVERRIVGPIEMNSSVDAETDAEGPGIAGL
jgi:hypothetical protein